jgi:hypothetical protein
MALTHHSDCRSPIQHVQSAEKNPDGLEKITDGFDDSR